MSYVLPLTYGVDILQGVIDGGNVLPLWLNFAAISGFCVILFYISLRNIHKRWIL